MSRSGIPGSSSGACVHGPNSGGMSPSYHMGTIGRICLFLALAETAGYPVRVVNVHETAERVVREIGASGAVITTSLHGLVTADAYGIPAVWTTLEPPLGGGAFKFHDYESVVTPGTSRFVPFGSGTSLDDLLASAMAAPRGTVEAVCDALEASAARLPEAIRAPGRFPRDLPQVLADRR